MRSHPPLTLRASLFTVEVLAPPDVAKFVDFTSPSLAQVCVQVGMLWILRKGENPQGRMHKPVDVDGFQRCVTFGINQHIFPVSSAFFFSEKFSENIQLKQVQVYHRIVNHSL